MHVVISEIITFCVITLCVRKVITICVERLLHFALKLLLHFASMLLHFALVLHFAAILITFCVNITFCGDYYILRRNTYRFGYIMVKVVYGPLRILFRPHSKTLYCLLQLPSTCKRRHAFSFSYFTVAFLQVFKSHATLIPIIWLTTQVKLTCVVTHVQITRQWKTNLNCLFRKVLKLHDIFSSTVPNRFLFAIKMLWHRKNN